MMRLHSPAVVAILLASAASLCAQTQYTGTGNPNPGEQHALELINRARANPTAEGTRLSIPGGIGEGLTAAEQGDINTRPPLAMNAILLQVAQLHSRDMWIRDYFDHDDIPPGNSAPDHWPWHRASEAGYAWNLFAENIATGSNHTTGDLEDILMIDSGYAGRGHRKALLDINPASTTYFREVGLGYYRGTGNQSNIFRDVLSEEFGRRNAVGPFVLGVVYNDTNGNNFYDPGEGMEGVTVRLNPAGASFAVTAYAGGYSFPATTSSGAITVQATGGQFGATIVSKTVTPAFSGENVKVDFRLSEAGLADTDGDGMLDSWENTQFGNLAETAAGDADGDTWSNRAEFNAGSNPMSAASTPTPPPPPAPPPPSGGGGGGGGGGGCGLTGLSVLWPVLLQRLRRRGRGSLPITNGGTAA